MLPFALARLRRLRGTPRVETAVKIRDPVATLNAAVLGARPAVFLLFPISPYRASRGRSVADSGGHLHLEEAVCTSSGNDVALRSGHLWIRPTLSTQAGYPTDVDRTPAIRN